MTPELAMGCREPEVGNWQRFLNEQHALDADGKRLVEDEAFGARTAYATRSWQIVNFLSPTGAVRSAERQAALRQGFIPFVRAMNFGPTIFPKARAIDVVVIHVMENDERPSDTAENVAIWFAGKNPRYPAPKASAHYCIDRDSIVQCVRDSDVAWHAPGCNHNGIGLEHAGRSRQTAEEWADAVSLRILDRSARHAAKLVQRYSLPVVRLRSDDLRAKLRGFTGHADVTAAFPGPDRDHLDPGPHFPWDWYLNRVQQLVAP